MKRKRSQSHNGISGPNPRWILDRVSTHGLSPSPCNQCEALHVPASRALLRDLIGTAQVTFPPSKGRRGAEANDGAAWKTPRPGALWADV